MPDDLEPIHDRESRPLRPADAEPLVRLAPLVTRDLPSTTSDEMWKAVGTAMSLGGYRDKTLARRLNRHELTEIVVDNDAALVTQSYSERLDRQVWVVTGSEGEALCETDDVGAIGVAVIEALEHRYGRPRR